MSDKQEVMSADERLAYMANQIARNFAAEGAERAANMVEDHIRLFWAPEMRRRLVELSSLDRTLLSPIAASAVARIGQR